jgi:PhoH-like ATPase
MAKAKGIAKKTEKRLFVLDTNVLMHDPMSILRFQEHDIYLPMVVLEELDANKKGLSETAVNVRQTNRFLDELLTGKTHKEIVSGLPLPTNGGRLFFQTNEVDSKLPTILYPRHYPFTPKRQT